MNDIVDMSQFVEAKTDQLTADDLIGSPRVITVTRVTGNDGDQPISVWFEGDNGRPFRPCKTMRRVLLAIWGRNAADYVGRSMRLYRDDSVTFGGLNVGGIRISHMSHIDKEVVVVVMKTKGKKAGIQVQPLQVERGPEPDAVQMATWAEKHIEAINRAPNLDKLDTFVGNRSAKLADLPDNLRDACQRAYDARRIELAAPADEPVSEGDIGF